MLVNIFHDSRSEHRRLFLYGLVYLVAVALLIGLSIAIYQKAFTRSTTITVQADRAGLQLAKFGDVRLHGVLVGSVRSIGSDGEHAVIKVALDPQAAKTIPADVGVEILPTTLFGQKFLELKIPAGAGARAISDGAVIPASRVTTNVELQSVLNNLFPLLRSIRPGDLNSTLYAIAHSLQGRGDQIGRTVEQLNSYLSVMNGQLPHLRKDLQLFARTAQTYDLAAPDIITLLRNATTSARTLTAKQGDLKQALSGLTGVSRSARLLLAENEEGIKAEGKAMLPVLNLLDTYSPEFPCLIEGISHQRANTANVFQNNRIHQTLELGAPQRKAYTAADKPVYGEVGHGPWCLGLPDNYQNPAGFLDLKDGSDFDTPGGGLK